MFKSKYIYNICIKKVLIYIKIDYLLKVIFKNKTIKLLL